MVRISRTGYYAKRRWCWRSHHHFSVPESGWTNGAVERVMGEVVRTLHAMLVGRKKPLNGWISVLPAVQWVLNTSWRPSIHTAPFRLMHRSEPRTGPMMMVDEEDGD